MTTFSSLIETQMELVAHTQTAAMEAPENRDVSVALATAIDKLATLISHSEFDAAKVAGGS